ncbi:MAG: hypothetical protein HQK49_21415 [Oligoflexia bacterium]|nr:hypothetical protein [Oligoflexia bacterium]
MGAFKVDIYTPAEIIQKDLDVESFAITTAVGDIAVLPDHASLVSKLSEGMLLIKQSKEKLAYKISTGVIKINKEKVLILSSFVQKIDDLKNIEFKF